MLYIKKKDAPRSLKTKVAEIKSSPQWRAVDPNDTKTLRDLFDELPKDAIRHSLLEEQHYLCAYCMARISDSGLHTSIEHWSSLSNDKDNALSYDNFLLVCKGGGDVSGLDPKISRILCCDASKGDQEIHLNPQDEEMMAHIAYTSEGIIKFHPAASAGRWTAEKIKKMDDELNQILCLNGKLEKNLTRTDTATQLIKGRKDAWAAGETIIKHLKSRKKYTSAQIRKSIEALKSAPQREPFVGVTIFYLERAYRKRKAAEEQSRF